MTSYWYSIVILWLYLMSFRRYSMSKNITTLKCWSRVTQGHWKWYHSIDWVWFPISVYCVVYSNFSLRCSVFETFDLSYLYQNTFLVAKIFVGTPLQAILVPIHLWFSYHNRKLSIMCILHNIYIKFLVFHFLPSSHAEWPVVCGNCNCNNISNAPPTSRLTAHYIVHKCLFIGAQ